MATLHVVSTPIGNLSDLSARAAETLCEADRILAEDTRRTRVLADHVGASASLVSVHAHNEAERIASILEWLEAGERLALVSDAGTPLVSDPGGRVVQAVIEAGHEVVPIPGPSAPLAALVGSGFVGERFTFFGFPGRKGKARAEDLAAVAVSDHPVVLFESPQRLVRLLTDLSDLCEEVRQVSVARELTKVYEEFRRGTLSEVAAYYQEHPPRGEVTVVVEGRPAAPSTGGGRAVAEALARELIEDGMRTSAVAKEVAKRLDLARNEAYRIVHAIEPSPAPSGAAPDDPANDA